MDELTNERVMTSLELLKLLCYKDLKTLHAAIINRFGQEINVGVEIQTSYDSMGYIKFYTLNENLSKMLVAKHDINCIERIRQYWVDKRMHQHCIDNKPAPKPMEVQPDSMMAALEIMADDLKLSNSEKVKAYAIGMKAYPDFVKSLPVYAVDDSQIDNHEGVNDCAAHTMIYHLKNSHLGSSMGHIHKKLVESGILEQKDWISSEGIVNCFNVLTEKGLMYGKNVINPNEPRETHPHYYDSMIEELLITI